VYNTEISNKILRYLTENSDNAFIVGIILFFIVGGAILTQIRNGGILDITLALNKFKFLTPIGRFLLVFAYLIFFTTIAILLFGLFGKA
jgi:hypothetical protein